MKKRLILFVMIAMLNFGMTAYAAPVVPVRAGIHDRYNRLVFDWSKPVKYKMEQNNGSISIQFDAQGTANFKPVNAVAPPFIRDLSQENTAAGLRVTFTIPNESRVQAFWSGNKVAFDVLRLNDKAPIFAKKEDQAAAVKPDETQGPQEPVKSVEEQAAPQAAATPSVPKPAEKDLAEQAVNPAAGTATAESIAAAVAQDKTPSPPAAPTEQPKTQTQNSKFQTLADALEGKKRVVESSVSVAQPAATPTATPVTKGTVIRLKPNKLSRLAAFQRAGKLWLLVDQAQNDLTPKVEGELLSALTNVKRITLPNATAFVFDFSQDDVKFSVRREGPEWDIWLNPEERPVLPPEVPLNVTQEKDKEPRVVLYAGEQPIVINIKDSDMGDRMWVVPMRAPEGRVGQKRQTAVYTMLPTLIGAVIIPQDDQLRVGTLNDLVVLSAADGKKVLISSENDRRYGKGEAKLTKAFRLDIPLKKSKDKDFREQRQELETVLTKQDSNEKKAMALLDLARLYLQQGFGPEAGGLLRIAQKQYPAVQTKTEFHALRGMASAMSGNRKDAEKDLTEDEIHSLPEAKLWLGYALSEDNDWQGARAAFAESGDAEKLFPAVLQNRLILARAETALEADDIITSQAELKKIKDLKELKPVEKAAYTYIRATNLASVNQQDDAIDLYRDIIDGTDQLYRAKAELNLVKHQVLSKKMKLPEAIERLEQLRFSWRGDRLEIDVLRQLGQYYIDNKQYFEGLTIWRSAASLSKNSDDTDTITQHMQDVFRKLYVDGDADKLPPLQSLSLFDRFRELTPSGEEGNVALRRLADRLASVDLFDQADPLLEQQILRQAQGEEAAVLGAKLAGWRLLNRNPAGALKILDESETQDTISDTLANHRVLLRARALADTGKTDEALALLKTDQSNEGLSLKADINWRQSRWSEAIVALQALASNYRDQGKTAVDGPVPTLVMKMAIALALDDNKKGMELLTAEYGAFMAKTPKTKAFDLITKQSRGGSLADIETLKGQVGEVELFQQFLKNFQP